MILKLDDDEIELLRIMLAFAGDTAREYARDPKTPRRDVLWASWKADKIEALLGRLPEGAEEWVH
jgi:hypothetical protein